jgi:glycosyltransferase involved in cell wall biosynthesis
VQSIANEFKYNLIDMIWVYNSINSGISSARNIGFKLAKYDAVLMLDSDDEILPDTLSIFSRTFQETRADVIYGIFKTEKDGRFEQKNLPTWTKGKLKKFGCYILGPRLISKKSYEYCGGFNELYRYSEDLDILMRIEKCGGKFIKVEENIGIVHDSDNRTTKTNAKDVNNIAAQIRGKFNV